MIASAQRTIPRDHPAFAGHFPGFPILPGAVLLAEMIAWIEDELRRVVVAAGSVKFLSAVCPGAICEFSARGRGEELETECRVGATTVMRATLSVARCAAGIPLRDPGDSEIR